MVVAHLLHQVDVVEAVGSPGLTKYACVVALLPLLSSPIILFFGKRTPGKGWIYGVLSVGAAFVLSLGILWHFVTGGGAYEANVSWFTIGPLHMELGELVDGLTAVMLVVAGRVAVCRVVEDCAHGWASWVRRLYLRAATISAGCTSLPVLLPHEFLA